MRIAPGRGHGRRPAWRSRKRSFPMKTTRCTKHSARTFLTGCNPSGERLERRSGVSFRRRPAPLLCRRSGRHRGLSTVRSSRNATGRAHPRPAGSRRARNGIVHLSRMRVGAAELDKDVLETVTARLPAPNHRRSDRRSAVPRGIARRTAQIRRGRLAGIVISPRPPRLTADLVQVWM